MLACEVRWKHITGIRFQWNGDNRAQWTLTVSTTSGRIGSVQRLQLNEFANMLLRHQCGRHVTVKVTDYKGIPGKEWFTYGHKPLILETGQKPEKKGTFRGF